MDEGQRDVKKLSRRQKKNRKKALNKNAKIADKNSKNEKKRLEAFGNENTEASRTNEKLIIRKKKVKILPDVAREKGEEMNHEGLKKVKILPDITRGKGEEVNYEGLKKVKILPDVVRQKSKEINHGLKKVKILPEIAAEKGEEMDHKGLKKVMALPKIARENGEVINHEGMKKVMTLPEIARENGEETNHEGLKKVLILPDIAGEKCEELNHEDQSHISERVTAALQDKEGPYNPVDIWTEEEAKYFVTSIIEAVIGNSFCPKRAVSIFQEQHQHQDKFFAAKRKHKPAHTRLQKIDILVTVGQVIQPYLKSLRLVRSQRTNLLRLVSYCLVRDKTRNFDVEKLQLSRHYHLVPNVVQEFADDYYECWKEDRELIPNVVEILLHILNVIFREKLKFRYDVVHLQLLMKRYLNDNGEAGSKIVHDIQEYLKMPLSN